MISKTNQAYLERLKQMAVEGIVRKTIPQLSNELNLCESAVRNVLMILRTNGDLDIIKTGWYITGVKLY